MYHRLSYKIISTEDLLRQSKSINIMRIDLTQDFMVLFENGL